MRTFEVIRALVITKVSKIVARRVSTRKRRSNDLQHSDLKFIRSDLDLVASKGASIVKGLLGGEKR